MSFWQDFQTLRLHVPHLALNSSHNENCLYTNYCVECKNCYLCTGASGDENCYYNHWIHHCADSADCSHLYHSQLCYESVDCLQCYNCNFCQDCSYSHNLNICYDCRSCRDCFGCINLQHKEHCIFNQQYSPAEYHEKIRELQKQPWSIILKQWQKLKQSLPHRTDRNVNVENCTGDYLQNCKNCYNCFDMNDCEDCCYTSFGFSQTKDVFDCDWTNNAQHCFNCIGLFSNMNMVCCYVSWYSSDLEYCALCFNCQNCFGCIALHNRKYYILNQPYTKEAYFQKIAEIKTELRQEDLYGQLPPSFYPYEDTRAQDFYPLQQ